MSEVLKDFSARALATAIEANRFEFFQYLDRSVGVEVHEGPSVTWFITGIPHPFMNGVFRTQLTSGDVDEVIEQTLAHFKARRLPFIWRIGSATRPTDMGRHLEAHGFDYSEGIGMAAGLLALNESPPTPSGLTIVPVDDKKTLAQWVHAVLIGFGLPYNSEAACFDLFAGLGFDLPLRNYVGLLDGKPVAASQLLLRAGVAGIYWVTTVPGERQQGIGTALTLKPLREAREMDYRIGILHASEMGKGVYRRLGFEEYSRVGSGLWMGERANNQ